MKIFVCIKRVPDTETRVRIGPDGRSIDPSGIKFVMSPYDEFALEAALRTREAIGGEVVVVTFGEEASTDILRSGLAMGADRALLLRGVCGSDGLSTAKTLAAALQQETADLVLFGLKAAGEDQGQVGPMTATILGRACATSVSSFKVEGDLFTCEREVDGGVQTVTLPIGSVLTITKGEFQPRYPSLKGIMEAKRKSLEIRDVPEVPPAVVVEGIELPAERQPGRLVGEGVDAVPELVRLLREEARVL